MNKTKVISFNAHVYRTIAKGLEEELVKFDALVKRRYTKRKKPLGIRDKALCRRDIHIPVYKELGETPKCVAEKVRELLTNARIKIFYFYATSRGRYSTSIEIAVNYPKHAIRLLKKKLDRPIELGDMWSSTKP